MWLFVVFVRNFGALIVFWFLFLFLQDKKLIAVDEHEESQKKYQTFVDEQRSYFKAVKDFQTECDKNEVLSDQLESR